MPAVVLFSIFLGVALIGIERKQSLLENLMLIERGLKRANQFAVSLTPIGLFAIAAQIVGTVDAAQFDQVRVYLIAYGAMALLLSLWVLPGLVACLTPIPVHQILNKTRDALITAFTTGELFIVLPILIDRSKELLIAHGLPEPRGRIATRSHRPRLLQFSPCGQASVAELRAIRGVVLADGA